MTASEALDDALLAMAERGETPPCFGLEGFTSDDPLERRLAARICDDCAIRELCQAAADERKESFGVWAGVDRTPRAYKHKESAWCVARGVRPTLLQIEAERANRAHRATPTRRSTTS